MARAPRSKHKKATADGRMSPRLRTRLSPAPIKDEPLSDPPYLNPTASWYSGDAWSLFCEIYQRCGLSTAKFIFQECISVADKQEGQAAAIDKAKSAQRMRELTKLPTPEEIVVADRKKICNWWARLPIRKLTAEEKRIVAILCRRYIEVGGYPKDFDPAKLPPIKKRGSVNRNAINAALPKLFDENNPSSAFSVEKAKRGGKLAMKDFAATLVPTYGYDADHVLANLRYHRRPKN
jgi:hypothetical protein